MGPGRSMAPQIERFLLFLDNHVGGRPLRSMRSGPWLYLSFLSLVACGGGGSRGSSEPGADGGAAAPVIVRVVDDGAPVPSAWVVFHTPQGGVANVVQTDAGGVAMAALPQGGLVTVAYPNAIELLTSRVQLLTYAGVSSGDELTVEIPSYGSGYSAPDPGPSAGSITVELPPIEGAERFVIHLGCADEITEELVTVVDVPEDCLGSDGEVDITVEAYSPPDLPTRLATTYATGIDVSPEENPTVSFPSWIAPLPSIDIELTDLPADVTDVFAVPVMLADRMAFEPVLADSAAVSGGGSTTLSPGFLPDFAEAMDLEVRLHDAGARAVTSRFFLGAPVASAIEVSGATFLPMVREASLGSDAAEISWIGSGDLSDAAGMFLYLSSSREENAVTRHRRWTVVAPPELSPPFALPELPPELSDYRPRSDDEDLEPGVVLFDLDWVDSYASFAAHHGTALLDDTCVPETQTSHAWVSFSGVFFGPWPRTDTY